MRCPPLESLLRFIGGAGGGELLKTDSSCCRNDNLLNQLPNEQKTS